MLPADGKVEMVERSGSFRMKAFVLFAMAVFVAYAEGWRNSSPSRRMPQPAKELWRAPFGKGSDAFCVDWRDGAKGRVTVENGALRVEKTNFGGMVVVTVAEPFDVVAGAVIQGCAACYDEAPADPNEAKAYVRLWSGRENLKWSRKDFEGGAAEAPVYVDLVNTPPGGFTRKICRTRVGESGKVTAAIVVEGSPSVTVWREWSVEDAVAADESWAGMHRTFGSVDRSNTMIPEREFDVALAADKEHTARMVKTSNGGVLEVDGRKVPSIIYKPTPFGKGVPFTGEGAMFERSGVDLQTVNIRLGAGYGRIGFWTKDGFDCAGAVRRVKNFMRSAPNSLFLITIRCDAYPEYAEEHPGEEWRSEDGAPVYGGCSSGYRLKGKPRPHTWLWVSNHSLVWRNDVKRLMSEFVAGLKNTGLAKRVVGVHLAGYHDGQFAVPVPDFSHAAEAAFRRRQKAVYGKVRWRTAPKFHKNAYLDPVADEALVAYQTFLKAGPMEMQEDFARHLRKEFGKPVIVGRWCMNPFGGSIMATLDLTPFVKSEALDFLVAQPRYQRRAPGLDCASRIPLASFALHGKMYLNEFDLRTWCGRCGETEARSAYLSRACDQQMWETVHRRLAGQMFANRMGWWYFDMSDNWFDNPGIQSDIAKVRRTAAELLAAPASPWRPSVAVIVDEEGLMLCNRTGAGFSNRERLNTSEQMMVLSASSVPYDILLAEDALKNPSIAEVYRAFLLVGFYHIDEARRGFIEHQRKRGAKMLFTADAGVCGGVEFCAGSERLKDPKSLSSKMFNAFARSAGAYVPVDSGLQVDMNGNFISVHCLRTGHYDFVLPFKADVTNLKTGKRMPAMRSLTLDVTGGETRWYALNEIK